MYQVTVKGRTLEELKDAVNDINNELHSNVKPVNAVVKVMNKELLSEAKVTMEENVTAPTMHLEEGEEEVPSLYTAHPSEVAAPVAMVNTNVEGELDAEGIPWDKRIHASSKGKVAKGTWRTKRGIDVAVLAQVKAELLQNIHIAANPVAIPAAPITPATPAVAAPVLAPVAVVEPLTMAPQIPAGPPAQVTIPAAVVAPIAPPMAVPAGGHTLESFKANMPMVIGTLITEGKLTQDYVNTLMNHFGVTEIWNVTDAQKAEMFDTFVAHSIVVKVG